MERVDVKKELKRIAIFFAFFIPLGTLLIWWVGKIEIEQLRNSNSLLQDTIMVIDK